MAYFAHDDLVAEVRHEVEMRKRVYPGLVSRGKMKAEDAERRTACMAHVLSVLLDMDLPKRARG